MLSDTARPAADVGRLALAVVLFVAVRPLAVLVTLTGSRARSDG